MARWPVPRRVKTAGSAEKVGGAMKEKASGAWQRNVRSVWVLIGGPCAKLKGLLKCGQGSAERCLNDSRQVSRAEATVRDQAPAGSSADRCEPRRQRCSMGRRPWPVFCCSCASKTAYNRALPADRVTRRSLLVCKLILRQATIRPLRIAQPAPKVACCDVPSVTIFP